MLQQVLKEDAQLESKLKIPAKAHISLAFKQGQDADTKALVCSIILCALKHIPSIQGNGWKTQILVGHK